MDYPGIMKWWYPQWMVNINSRMFQYLPSSYWGTPHLSKSPNGHLWIYGNLSGWRENHRCKWEWNGYQFQFPWIYGKIICKWVMNGGLNRRFVTGISPKKVEVWRKWVRFQQWREGEISMKWRWTSKIICDLTIILNHHKSWAINKCAKVCVCVNIINWFRHQKKVAIRYPLVMTNSSLLKMAQSCPVEIVYFFPLEMAMSIYFS